MGYDEMRNEKRTCEAFISRFLACSLPSYLISSYNLSYCCTFAPHYHTLHHLFSYNMLQALRYLYHITLLLCTDILSCIVLSCHTLHIPTILSYLQDRVHLTSRGSGASYLSSGVIGGRMFMSCCLLDHGGLLMRFFVCMDSELLEVTDLPTPWCCDPYQHE